MENGSQRRSGYTYRGGYTYRAGCMPHNEHNVIPFWNGLNDSNGRMRYLSLYLYPDGDDGGLCWLKATLTPGSEITLTMLYMLQIISLLLSVSCTTNKESGSTQYFI